MFSSAKRPAPMWFKPLLYIDLRSFSGIDLIKRWNPSLISVLAVLPRNLKSRWSAASYPTKHEYSNAKPKIINPTMFFPCIVNPKTTTKRGIKIIV